MRKFCLFAYSLTVFAQTPVFKSATTLQSIAVQVTDKQGNSIQGLTAADFTLLEDGRPQKIAFFGAEKQPISLAVLIDSSTSMSYGGKLGRAVSLLGPLLRGNHPEDEIFLVPFTERLQPLGQLPPFTPLSMDQRPHPPAIGVSSTSGGTALYDALASALCHMRTARNVRQAVVVITDGADQNSRLSLEQLIQLTRSSNPQTFMIGFFEKSEYDIFRQRNKTLTLLGEREIDNPLIVFDRLAKESGAESFYPSSEHDLQQALDRISAILDAEYTLAYYPGDTSRFRKIEVKVKRGGVHVLSRRSAGSESGDTPVHFQASSCEVSATDHPYPWELRAIRNPSGALIYREDFSDPRTGWPNRREKVPDISYTSSGAPSLRDQTGKTSAANGRDSDSFGYQSGVRYIKGGYELSRSNGANTADGPIADGVVAAYGPFWNDFRASVLIEASFDSADASQTHFTTAPGLVFHMGPTGYYALVLSGAGPHGTDDVAFKLIRRKLSPGSEAVLLPWTKIAFPASPAEIEKKARKLSVQYSHGRIEVQVDDQPVGSVQDTTFPHGLIGLALFGHGRAVFHDLLVEGLP
jgi:Ca-activated chloride channel homolog